MRRTSRAVSSAAKLAGAVPSAGSVRLAQGAVFVWRGQKGAEGARKDQRDQKG